MSCNNIDHLIDVVSSEESNQDDFQPTLLDENKESNQNSINSKSRDTFFFQHRGIHIVSLNIRHIKPKVDELKILLSELNQIEILGVCETLLNNSIDGTLLYIENYTFERKDRDTCNQIETNIEGGVLIYINDKIN